MFHGRNHSFWLLICYFIYTFFVYSFFVRSDITHNHSSSFHLFISFYLFWGSWQVTMSIRNMEERILTVSSVCQIDRESSKSLLQKHGWKCDLAISGYFKWSSFICRFFDGELEEIHHSQNSVKENEPFILWKWAYI